MHNKYISRSVEIPENLLQLSTSFARNLDAFHMVIIVIQDIEQLFWNKHNSHIFKRILFFFVCITAF